MATKGKWLLRNWLEEKSLENHFPFFVCWEASDFAISMRKFPKSRNYRSLLSTGIKAVLVVEGLFLVGTYALWNQMNSSRDFRFKVYNYCPPVLESYYWMGETLGNLPTRQMDYKAWGVCKEK